METTTEKLSEAEKAERRVQIAKDVIEQVRAGKFRGRRMQYCSVYSAERTNPFGLGDLGRDLRDLISDGRIAFCTGCAWGAMFIAHVMRFDDARITRDHILGGIDGFGNDAATSERLREIFDAKELDQIEAYYEGWFMHDKFKERFPELNDRLTAICETIVANGGTFVP